MMEDKKLFILDMDGTIYLGDQLFPETLPFLKRIQDHGGDYLFFTNNASRARDTYLKRLRNFGIPVRDDQILTSGDVTIHFLKAHRPGSRVYLVGTEDLSRQIFEAGVCLVEENPDIVLISFDTALTYEKLKKACHYIRHGAEFLSTHPDLNCPMPEGPIPDSGSICALITASTGVEPRYFGKPYPETIEMLLEETGCTKEDMAIVGDRLYTEIRMGVDHGVTAVLVLSGETTREDLEKSSIVPDIVVENVGELL